MPITVNYRPAASVVGGAAFLGGQGEFAKERDKFLEQQRQYDEQQALRAMQFGEQQRQFDASQALREQQVAQSQNQFDQRMDFDAWKARTALADGINARRAATRQQQDALAAGSGQAMMNAVHGQDQVGIEQQRMAAAQQQAQIEMQQAQQKAALDLEQKKAYEKFAVEQGWMKATPEFMDEQASEVTDFLSENRDYLEDQTGYKRAMADLRNLQRGRGTMRPDQYSDAVGQWVERNDPSRWRVNKPKTAQETIDQSIAVTPGGVEMIVGPDGVPKPVPPPKAEKSSEPTQAEKIMGDPAKVEGMVSTEFNDIFNVNVKAYEAGMKRYNDAEPVERYNEATNPGGIKMPVLEIPDREKIRAGIVAKWGDKKPGRDYFDIGRPEMAQPAPGQTPGAASTGPGTEGSGAQSAPPLSEMVAEAVGAVSGDGSEQSPLVFPADMSAEQGKQIMPLIAGLWIVHPDTGKLVQIPLM